MLTADILFIKNLNVKINMQEDHIDAILAQWAEERPDVNVASMGIPEHELSHPATCLQDHLAGQTRQGKDRGGASPTGSQSLCTAGF